MVTICKVTRHGVGHLKIGQMGIGDSSRLRSGVQFPFVVVPTLPISFLPTVPAKLTGSKSAKEK